MTRDKLISLCAKGSGLCLDQKTCEKHYMQIDSIIEDIIYEVKERVTYAYEGAIFESIERKEKGLTTLLDLKEVLEAIEPVETMNSK